MGTWLLLSHTRQYPHRSGGLGPGVTLATGTDTLSHPSSQHSRTGSLPWRKCGHSCRCHPPSSCIRLDSNTYNCPPCSYSGVYMGGASDHTHLHLGCRFCQCIQDDSGTDLAPHTRHACSPAHTTVCTPPSSLWSSPSSTPPCCHNDRSHWSQTPALLTWLQVRR